MDKKEKSKLEIEVEYLKTLFLMMTWNQLEVFYGRYWREIFEQICKLSLYNVGEGIGIENVDERLIEVHERWLKNIKYLDDIDDDERERERPKLQIVRKDKDDGNKQ